MASKAQTHQYLSKTFKYHDNVLYYLYSNDSVEVDTTKIILKFISSIPSENISGFADDLDLTLLNISKHGYHDYQLPDSLTYFHTLVNLDTATILEDINISFFIPYQKRPDDPKYLEPPNVYDSLAYWVIEAEKAWDLTTGDPNIKVVILDTGLETDHEDLAVGSYGYTNIDFANSWNYINSSTNIDEEYDSDCHGTNTSGIIGAKMNNNLGVASIAGGWTDRGVTIIMHAVGPYAVDISVVDNAIYDAVDKGAHIISCSFALKPPLPDDLEHVEEAIDDAVEAGVMVFASSGNETGPVWWPASYEPVIAVGGTQAEWDGLILEEEIWDPEGFAGSAYGEELDISAPARITTTFAINYNNISKYESFVGTSTSCPLTAGIAALMLSLSPCHSAEQVEQLLYSTADKVGGYDYNHDPERPGHSEELGYGRVNAWEAVNTVYGLLAPDYTIDNTQTWSNDLYYSYDDIEILPGGTLILESNVILRMGDENKIIIHQGGALYINGATITCACDGPWRGIEVYGNSYVSQTPQNQGMVVINNGTISNAHCGISTAKMGSAPGGAKNVYNRDYSGGIIAANQARFEYNVNAVSFYPYALNNISFFDSCVFVTEIDLPGASVHDYFVKMYSVQGVSFTRCFFENDSFTIPETLGGIYSFSSIFDLDGKCENQSVPCNTSYEYSRFKNLHYGIRAFTYIPTRWVDIRHTEFDNNVHGIYLSGIENARITTNTFNLNHSAVSDSCYGLYLDECTGYWVEDNDFHGPVNSQKGFGIVVNHSGPYDNEIYNNRFENTEYGINAQKENRNPESGGEFGLQILCNKFVNCASDISVTQAEGTGIAYRQGTYNEQDPSAPAGNRFSHIGNSSVPSDINNEGEDIDYYYHDDNLEPVEPLDYTEISIEAIEVYTNSWNNELSCPSCLETGGVFGRTEFRESITNAEQKSDSTSAILAQLVDGGDTEDLQNTVDYSIPAESMEVYNELMANSPYLSDTVIESAIYKEDVLPNTMIRDIMVANPQSAEQDSLMEKIDERWDPMPDYMRAEILQGINSFSYKEELEALKAGYAHKRSHALNFLVRSFVEDTLSHDLIIDSIINVYTNENSLESKYKIAFLYAEKLMFQAGNNIIDSIPDEFSLISTQQGELEVFLDYFDYLESCYQDTSIIIYPDSTQLTELLDLIYFETRKIAVLARSILIASGNLDYAEPIFFPNPYKSDKDIEYAEILFSEHTKDSRFTVYPNPSRDYIVAEYSSENENFKGEITIYEIGGKLLNTISLNKSRDQLLINTQSLKQGAYIASLEIEGKHIESVKFTIAR